MTQVDDHLTDSQIERYRQNALTILERYRVDEHLSRCDTCRARYGVAPGHAWSRKDEILADADGHVSPADLSAYAAGTLSVADRMSVARHLDICDRCSRYASELLRIGPYVAIDPSRDESGSLKSSGGDVVHPTLRRWPTLAFRSGAEGNRGNAPIVNVLSWAVAALTIAVVVLSVSLRSAMVARGTGFAEPGLAPVAAGGEDAEPDRPSAAGMGPVDAGFDTAPALPPDDVVNYLRFLRRIDQRRMALQTSTPAGPVSADVSARWRGLISSFRDSNPPESCRTLAADYLILLADIQISTGRSDPTAADAGVLQSDANSADAEMKRLCDATHIDKPFDIQARPANY
jgi:hypothetical protein